MSDGKRMGRPPVAKDKAKSSLLSVQFSEAERAALEAAAEREGLTLSQWARRVLLSHMSARGSNPRPCTVTLIGARPAKLR